MQNRKTISLQSSISVKKRIKLSLTFFTNVKTERKIWDTFEPIIKKLNRNAEDNPLQHISGLNAINTEKKTRKLIMTINMSILNKIWTARNLFKHEQKKIPTANIIQDIKKLKKIITIHYNKHEKYNTIPTKIYNKQRKRNVQSKTIF